VRKARGLDPSVAQVGVREPGVVRENLASERLQQPEQPPADVAEPDEADPLAEEQRRVERARAVQELFLRETHGAVLRHEIAAACECESERHLRDGGGEGGRHGQHPDTAPEAVVVVELGRPPAGHGDDCAQLLGAVQHGPVPPAG
jgi:hypothetical protein